MNHTIQLTAEQFQVLQSGQPITIEPPKPTTTKWEPKPGAFTINLISLVSYEAISTNKYRLAGVEYQTQSQADSAAKQLRAYARQLAWLAENDDGWVADWNNKDQAKYFVDYTECDARYAQSWIYLSRPLCTVYMSSDNAYKLCKLLNDGIVEF